MLRVLTEIDIVVEENFEEKMDGIKEGRLRYFYKLVSIFVNVQIQKQKALFYILKTVIGKGDAKNILSLL